MRPLKRFKHFDTLNTAAVIVLTVLLLVVGNIPLQAREQADARAAGFEVFKEAKMAIYQKEWLKAVDLLKTFEKDFPGSHYFDDAVYWLAYSQDKLSTAFKDPLQEVEIKKEALQNLDRLIDTIRDSSWVDDAKTLRIKIYSELVRAGQKEYLQNILETLRTAKESETDLMVVALDALIRLDTEQALPFLEKILKESRSSELRTKIIFIVSNSKDRRLQDLLNRILLEQPRWIKKVEPIYPIDALRNRVQGKVLLEVVTDSGGSVIKATVIKGHPMLRDAAVRAALQWKHEPVPVKDKPVSRVFTVTIDFEIY